MARQKFETIFRFKNRLVVLALGPHADDIELGCAATLLYLRKKFNAIIHYVVFCDHYSFPRFQMRRKEIEKSAGMLSNDSFVCWAFEDSKFPNAWREIQDRISNLQKQYKPHLVLAPREDNHQDHVTVAQAARREIRRGQAFWQYEIKQFGQDQFQPDIYVNVSEPSGCREAGYKEFLSRLKAKDTFAHRKVYILQKCMKSQINKPFMNEELILGTMRFRAMQVSPDIEYAEAFKGTVLL